MFSFHSNNGYAKAPQCNVVRTLPVLLHRTPVLITVIKYLRNKIFHILIVTQNTALQKNWYVLSDSFVGGLLPYGSRCSAVTRLSCYYYIS